MMDKKMPTIMQKNFQRLDAPKPNRSRFDIGHSYKGTFSPAFLYPVFAEQMIPGDTFRFTAEAFIRMIAQVKPTMDNGRVILEAFFEPYRLVWDNFERFMGQRDPDPDSSIDYLFPRLGHFVDGNPANFDIQVTSLGDYLRYPTEEGGGMYKTGDNDDFPSAPSAELMRTYYDIWNNWYRSDALQDRLVFPRGDGPDEIDDYVLQVRNKAPDYYSMALPWPQRGEAVPLPLGLEAPVVGNGLTLGLTDGQGGGTSPVGLRGNSGGDFFTGNLNTFGEPIGSSSGINNALSDNSYGVSANPESSGLIALLSDATAATINVLREAIVVQHMLEVDARAGSRYIDQVKMIFGVTIPDYRLQRPEYVGGSRGPIGIHSVAQTTPTASTNPQAGLAAYGTGLGKLSVSYSALEHGTLMVLMSITADLSYQQQMRRSFTRRTRFDFYRPEMAHLGEQPLLNREMRMTGTLGDGPTGDEGIWGYQARWSEMHSIPSTVVGLFRTNTGGNYDVYHWATWYDTLPALGPTWLEDDPPFDRSAALEDQPLFEGWINFSGYMDRPMPVYAIPGLTRL